MEKNLGATSAPSSYLGWSGIDNDCDQAILELRLPTTPSTELPIKKFLLFMNWSSSKKEKLESGPKEYTRQRGWHLASLNKTRSEEHTSELQSRGHLVCRLLLEKNNR